MKEATLIRRSVKLLKCDSGRIVTAGGTLFFLMGTKRNTKDDPGQWLVNGEPKDWDYTHEATVANGATLPELWKSVQHYARIHRMTMLEFLRNEMGWAI